MIKNIVLDIDGVVINPDKNIKLNDILPANLKKKYANRFNGVTICEYGKLCDDLGKIDLFDAGKIDYETYLKNVWQNGSEAGLVRVREEEVEVVNELYAYVKANLKNWVVPEAKKLIEDLVKEGYNVYIFSNVNQYLLPEWKKLVNKKYISGAIYSCEIGLTKPNVEAYKKALKTWKIKAEETLFVDDREKNLAPFTRLMGYTFLFNASDAQNECARLTDYITKINRVG